MTIETRTVAGETPRYRVDEGSNSAHCCFDFTVVDTTRQLFEDAMDSGGDLVWSPWMRHGKPECETLCECFDEESARLICDALNARVAVPA